MKGGLMIPSVALTCMHGERGHVGGGKGVFSVPLPACLHQGGGGCRKVSGG